MYRWGTCCTELPKRTVCRPLFSISWIPPPHVPTFEASDAAPAPAELPVAQPIAIAQPEGRFGLAAVLAALGFGLTLGLLGGLVLARLLFLG